MGIPLSKAKPSDYSASHLFPEALFCQWQHHRGNYKLNKLFQWQLHPHHFFPLQLFHSQSQTTEMEPQHLRRSVRQQKQTVLLTTISSSLLPCLGWGRISNPHLNSMSCHVEVKPELQPRSELCAQVFQKSSTPNTSKPPGFRNCFPDHLASQASLTWHGDCHSTSFPHRFLSTGSLAVHYTRIFPSCQ